MGRKNRPRTEKREGTPLKEAAYARKRRLRAEGIQAPFQFESPERLGERHAQRPETQLTPATDPRRVKAVVSDMRKVKVGYIYLTGPDGISIHLATHVLRGVRVDVGHVLDCTVQHLVGKSSPTVIEIHKIATI
jgi:hypothetical protein